MKLLQTTTGFLIFFLFLFISFIGPVLHIQASTPPSITIVQPDGTDDTSQGSYTITWTDSDPDDDALISLFYSPDTLTSGQLIIAGLTEDATEDSYIWDTSGVTPGSYYIRGVIQDSDNAPASDWSDGKLTIQQVINTPPTLQIIQPDGYDDIAGDTFTIAWNDSDPDSLAEISFYYSINNVSDPGTFIVSGKSEESSIDSYVWDLRANNVPAGKYYIKGTIWDGNNAPVSVYSPGKIHIVSNTTSPYMFFNEPADNNDYADSTFKIKWSDLDSDSNAMISIYYDTDNSGSDGTLIAQNISEDDTTDSIDWNFSGLTGQQYWIYGVITDGINPPLTVYSDTPINVNSKPTITLLSPDGINDSCTGAFTITWQALDTDDDALIALYYDNNNTDFDGISIASGLSEDSVTSHIWDTSQLTQGLYYVYAVISDFKNEPYMVYADGPLTIDRRGSIRHIRVSGLSPDSATITWSSDIDGTGWVDYSSDDTLSQHESSLSGKDHFITLTNLTASTTYNYRVRTTDVSLELIADNKGEYFKFTTPSASTTATNRVFSGVVRDSLGNPAANVPIFFSARKKNTDLADLSGFLSTKTGPDGSFSINSISLISTDNQALSIEQGDDLFFSVSSAAAGSMISSFAYIPTADTSNLEFSTSSDDNVTLPFSLAKGFSIISFPASGIVNTTSKTFMETQTSIIAMYRFDSSTQGYQSCLKLEGNTFIGNFTLSPVEAYFIKTTTAVEFMYQTTGRIVNPLTLELKKGFNLSGFAYSANPPFDMSTGYHSKLILEQVKAGSAFYYYNSSTGQYESTLRLDDTNYLGDEINVIGGQGFFIKMLDDSLFNALR